MLDAQLFDCSAKPLLLSPGMLGCLQPLVWTKPPPLLWSAWCLYMPAAAACPRLHAVMPWQLCAMRVWPEPCRALLQSRWTPVGCLLDAPAGEQEGARDFRQHLQGNCWRLLRLPSAERRPEQSPCFADRHTAPLRRGLNLVASYHLADKREAAPQPLLLGPPINSACSRPFGLSRPLACGQLTNAD